MDPKDVEGMMRFRPYQTAGSIVSLVDLYLTAPKEQSGLVYTIYQGHSRGARWFSGRVSDSGARGRGFETYRRRVVFLSKTLYSSKVLVNYPGSSGSVPT